MRAVPFDALGVSLALSGIPAEVLARLGAREGLFQEAVVVSHDLWDPDGGTLASHRWDIYTDTIPFLAKVLLYDSDRMISLAQGNGDTDLGSVSTLGGLKYLNISSCFAFTNVGVGSLSALPALVHLDLSGCPQVSDISLSLLSNLQTLQRLEVAMCWEITDAGLGNLSNMHALEHLNLSGCPQVSDISLSLLSNLRTLQRLEVAMCWEITDVGLGHLSNMHALVHLNLSRCQQVSDIGLARLPINLKHLNIDSISCVSDAGASSLARLKKLEWLAVGQCSAFDQRVAIERTKGLDSFAVMRHRDVNTKRCAKMTDAGVASLSSLVKLEHLDLGGLHMITDAALLNSLSKLATLQNLNLSDCPQITDIGVGSLSVLQALRVLSLCCSKVTDVGLTALSRLDHLEELSLTECGMITEAGLGSLSTIAPLRQISVGGREVSKERLASLHPQ